MTQELYISKYKKLSKTKSVNDFLAKIGNSTFKENSLEIDISKYKKFLDSYKNKK